MNVELSVFSLPKANATLPQQNEDLLQVILVCKNSRKSMAKKAALFGLNQFMPKLRSRLTFLKQ